MVKIINCHILLLLALFLLSKGRVYSQENLSLSDAINLTLERNYDIVIQEKSIDIATNNNDWGQAGRYPTISLQVNQNNSLTDNIKTASPFQLQDQTFNNSLSPSVNINWTIFNGFRINMTKARLAQLQERSSGNADIIIANALQTVILGYYRVVFEKERLEEFQKQKNLSRDRYEYTQLKSELGSAVSSELLLEEGNYLSDSVSYINQELIYRNACRDLNLVMAEDNPNKIFNMMDSLQFENQDYDFEDLLVKMNAKNVDLKTQYLAQSILTSDRQLAKGLKYPSLTFIGGYSHNRSRVDLSNASFPNDAGGFSPGPADPLSAITDNYFANFTLSFTLFNGGQINRAIKNAVINEEIEALRTDQIKTRLYRDLAQAFEQYQTRLQLHAINVRREEVAEANLRISEERFKGGTINSFDYRTVQNTKLVTSIVKLQSLYNLIDSKVTLMRLTGGIIETYKN